MEEAVTARMGVGVGVGVPEHIPEPEEVMESPMESPLPSGLKMKQMPVTPPSSMVRFMGEHSHISVEFDNIVSAVLENYEVPKENSESLDHEEQGTDARNEDQISPMIDVKKRNPSWSKVVNDKGEVNFAMEDDKNPSFWSRVCLHNMANLAKEGTTIRRVMESLFRYFDNGNLWSIKHIKHRKHALRSVI